MARTYRDIAIEEMLGTVEEAISQVIDWRGDLPPPMDKAGESFSELPGDRHSVSANASDTESAKLLAVFVVDTNETELTTPLGN